MSEAEIAVYKLDCLYRMGIIRMCNKCSFVTTDRTEWRKHERKEGHVKK